MSPVENRLSEPNGQLPDDPLDLLLRQLPGESVPPDLAGRIKRTIQTRNERRTRLSFALNLGLALLGAWLVVPSLAGWLSTLSLPETGLPMLFTWLQAALIGLEIQADQVAGSLASTPSFVRSTLGLPAWLGFTALALSALLELGQLLQKKDTY